MTSEYRPGATCERRPGKPGDKWGRWWTTQFPVTLVRPFHIEGYWWVEDVKGHMWWVKETDLVVVRAVTEQSKTS